MLIWPHSKTVKHPRGSLNKMTLYNCIPAQHFRTFKQFQTFTILQQGQKVGCSNSQEVLELVESYDESNSILYVAPLLLSNHSYFYMTALRILTPPMETPYPPNDTPKRASKQVANWHPMTSQGLLGWLATKKSPQMLQVPVILFSELVLAAFGRGERNQTLQQLLPHFEGEPTGQVERATWGDYNSVGSLAKTQYGDIYIYIRPMQNPMGMDME